MKYLKSLLLMAVVLLLAACSDSGHQPPEPDDHTLIIYMVGTNSLSQDAVRDHDEITIGARKLPRGRNVLVFYYNYDSDPALYRVDRNGKWNPVEKYTGNVSMLNPSVIRKVIDKAKDTAPAHTYGLILWSHATGWSPSQGLSPMSFGQDYRTTVNIDRLASILQDGEFEYIWCDCCYMGGIETAYEFRKKARRFIASPTPTMSWGLPYDQVLPLLNPDVDNLKEAARTSYAYTMAQPGRKGLTISIINLAELTSVAETASRILDPDVRPDLRGLQRYDIDTSVPPLYDFRQYVLRAANMRGLTAESADFDAALDRAVEFKLASPEFITLTINPSNFSGLSTHAYGTAADVDNFYRKLAWCSEVIQN